MHTLSCTEWTQVYLTVIDNILYRGDCGGGFKVSTQCDWELHGYVHFVCGITGGYWRTHRVGGRQFTGDPCASRIPLVPYRTWPFVLKVLCPGGCLQELLGQSVLLPQCRSVLLKHAHHRPTLATREFPVVCPNFPIEGGLWRDVAAFWIAAINSTTPTLQKRM